MLWRFDTEVAKEKHGVRMIRMLTGAARAAADEVPLKELMSEAGCDAALSKLKEHFAPALPRAFEKAVYADPRRPRETLQDYIIKSEAAFKELQDEGVTHTCRSSTWSPGPLAPGSS